MSKNITLILILIIFMTMIIVAFIDLHSCQDQEIEELRGQIASTTKSSFQNLKKNIERQKMRECFDLVDKMMECPEIELELP